MRSSCELASDKKITRVMLRLLAAINGVFRVSSLIPIAPIIDPSWCPWTQALEESWKEIREDADGIAERGSVALNFRELFPERDHVGPGGCFKICVLQAYGFLHERNLRN